MEGSTFFASPEVSIVAVGLLTLFALVDVRNKKIRLRALVIPLLFVLLVMGEIYGKSVVHHPSPPYFMIKNPTSIFPKYYINEQFSYPSGHTARAVFLGITFYSLFMIHNSLFKRKKLHVQVAFGALVLLYILIVAISRIYLGHHWLSDVIGGGILGGGLGLFVFGII
jgi:undecaprenyl-diphosphatase